MKGTLADLGLFYAATLAAGIACGLLFAAYSRLADWCRRRSYEARFASMRQAHYAEMDARAASRPTSAAVLDTWPVLDREPERRRAA